MVVRSSKRPERKPSRTVLVSRTAFRVLAGITDAELALWEREEFIVPVGQADSVGERLYDSSALKRARLIRTLADELDVNLPGIEVILHLLDQMER
ncbi:MAG: MerR family transcriptional regulator [Deltaproteobacteria bacterium]|nr:MerR family transcriptional regulator [Deltaproteobacteria bacterium]